MNINIPGYDPSSRKRCVNVAWRDDRPWREGRHVRILHPGFGYAGRVGIVTGIGAERVYVKIRLGKKPGQWDCVAYLPEHLRLI